MFSLSSPISELTGRNRVNIILSADERQILIRQVSQRQISSIHFLLLLFVLVHVFNTLSFSCQNAITPTLRCQRLANPALCWCPVTKGSAAPNTAVVSFAQRVQLPAPEAKVLTERTAYYNQL